MEPTPICVLPPPAAQSRMSGVDGQSSNRSGRPRVGLWMGFVSVALIVAAAVLGPLAIVPFLAIGVPWLSLSFGLSCSPPTPAQLEAQRSFVLAHLPLAKDVEVGHRDCATFLSQAQRQDE